MGNPYPGYSLRSSPSPRLFRPFGYSVPSATPSTRAPAASSHQKCRGGGCPLVGNISQAIPSGYSSRLFPLPAIPPAIPLGYSLRLLPPRLPPPFGYPLCSAVSSPRLLPPRALQQLPPIKNVSGEDAYPWETSPQAIPSDCSLSRLFPSAIFSPPAISSRSLPPVTSCSFKPPQPFICSII